MVHNRITWIAWAFLSLIFCGCEKSESLTVGGGDETIVAVAGRKLTMHEVQARANNIALLMAHRDGNNKRMEKIRATFIRGYPERWVEDAVLAAEAAREKVAPGEDRLATCRKNAFTNFKTKGDKKYEDLLAIPGLDRAFWEAEVRSEALRAAVREYWVGKFPPELPPNYAEGVTSKILAHNAEWSQTNRLQFAKATNVWQKIVAGADFVATAKAETELTEEIEDNCEWAVLDDRFMADEPALLDWVKKAKPGDISPPLVADGGLVIVRLDRLEADDGYALSRIFIHLAEVLPPAPKEEIEAAYRKRAERDLFNRLLAAAVAAAKPVYSKNFKTEQAKEKDRK